MTIVERVDDFGKPAWIGLVVLGFFVWWPLGLIVLAFLAGSRRMGCWSHGNPQRWQRRMERMQAKAERWCGPQSRSTTSGNRAFDEYRAETLRRLEDEQQEFLAFLDRLRQAKDKAEFDQFMAERGHRPDAPPPVN